MNVGGMFSKFANDTNICGIVDSEGSYQQLQWDLDQPDIWVEIADEV